MEISFKQTLFSIDPKNKRCNDCGEKHISYVSINNGITICNLCVQIHRQLGPKVSKLKKIDEEFDDYSMNFFIYGGNKNFHKFLKDLGVNSSIQRSKLYKTKGADYYRKYLLAKVKGVENTSKKPDNPNEIMEYEKDENTYNNCDILLKEDQKIKEDKHSINNIHNFLNINDNLENKKNLKEGEYNHVESHIELNIGNTGGYAEGYEGEFDTRMALVTTSDNQMTYRSNKGGDNDIFTDMEAGIPDDSSQAGNGTVAGTTIEAGGHFNRGNDTTDDKVDRNSSKVLDKSMFLNNYNSDVLELRGGSGIEIKDGKVGYKE